MIDYLTTDDKMCIFGSYAYSWIHKVICNMWNIFEPCIIDICAKLFGNNQVTKIKNKPMSIDTINKRIIFKVDDV